MDWASFISDGWEALQVAGFVLGIISAWVAIPKIWRPTVLTLGSVSILSYAFRHQLAMLIGYLTTDRPADGDIRLLELVILVGVLLLGVGAMAGIVREERRQGCKVQPITKPSLVHALKRAGLTAFFAGGLLADMGCTNAVLFGACFMSGFIQMRVVADTPPIRKRRLATAH